VTTLQDHRATLTRTVKGLGVTATAGMFVVLVMGATVTNTGSERGCGKSWPLCHGKLIPQFAMSTFIEWSHRFVVGIESVLILAFAAGVLYLYRRRAEFRILVPLMVGFLFLQAMLGAWAVMYPQATAILALHFGVSLVAFASVFLTAALVLEVDAGGTTDVVRDRAIPRAFRLYAWVLAGYTYVVVYSGAYVRHTNADDACTGWPGCNGSAIPDFHGKVLSAFLHRSLAALLTIGVIVLVVWSARLRSDRPDLYRAALAALGLVVLQALIGAAVVWTNMDIFTALGHAAVVGLMFASLTYVCVHVLPRPVEEQIIAVRASPPVIGAAPSGR
jgi:cytochrome c oxidase assembly protein subunit 15